MSQRLFTDDIHNMTFVQSGDILLTLERLEVTAYGGSGPVDILARPVV